MSDVRRKPKQRDVERLSRGQSHDVLTRLENCGLTPSMADVIAGRREGYARAIVEVVADPQRWQNRIREWFRARLFDHFEVPDLTVAVGERVERALRNQVPFYFPPTYGFATRELLDLQTTSGDHFDLRWSELRVIDPAPLFTEVGEGYWFWMQMDAGDDFSARLRFSEAPRLNTSYFTPEHMAAHAASLDEFLIGSIIGSSLGRPLCYGNDPKRVLALRTVVRVPEVTGGGAHPERDEYLVSTGIVERGGSTLSGRPAERRGFTWNHSTLGELETAFRTNPDGWDYCWVERVPASVTASAA